MGIKGLHHLLFVMFLIVSVAQSSEECMEDPNLATLNRNSFPSDFVFGTASSAYQYEGGANEGGRGPSIWDTFTKEYPDKIKDHSNGDIAVDSYHRYKEDVALMKDLGFCAYRFSISWSRLIPSGHIDGGINQEGINYYSSVINELLSNGIRPFVTLFHWDVPQVLEDEYGGFLSSKIINDFSDYADVCFSNFGDRVKQWITLNEPLTFATGGYDSGTLAPGRCSKWFSSSCSGGDSSTEPYIVGHHLLLAHAAAVRLYRDKYKVSHKGQIGITLNSNWILPSTESTTDHIAASRVLAFQYDWFMEPLKSGAYPVEMVTYVQERLPQFSEQQSSVLKGSFDFIGINYYTSYYATDIPCTSGNLSYSTDHCVKLTSERNGIPIGQKAGSEWLFAYPKGIEDLLLYTKYKFNDPVIFITENGVSELNINASISLEDNMRVDYYKTHLTFLQRAIMIGTNVKGFFAWSLLDNFEWADGYTVRFGIVYTENNDGLERQPKKSATWFKGILHQSKAND